jgi:argininosuccinate synthase
MLFHEGQFLDPVMRNRKLSRRHTKNCKRSYCSLKPSLYIDGIESENDLMNTSFGQYGEMNNGHLMMPRIYQILRMLKTYFHL